MIKVFNEEGTFRATYAAEAWCEEHGISVGRAQGMEPRGLLFGDFDIAKWRNLNAAERKALHGTMTGDGRNGPVTVTLNDNAVKLHRAELLSADMIRTALLSPCGTYRHNLRRAWDSKLPTACVVMLNPSTADAENDDPTIRKLIGFGRRLGWGGFEVVNLFSYRATKPSDLKKAGYRGQTMGDDDYIIRAALNALRTGGPVICAWGANARGLQRPEVVRTLLRQSRVPLHALRLLPDGTPEHPLMLPYTCTPIPLSN